MPRQPLAARPVPAKARARLPAPVLGLVALALAAAAVPAAAGPGGQICEVDAADPSPVPWLRLQNVAARVAERCHGGDVMTLFPFDAGGHAADVSLLAPLVCRFDAQILLMEHGSGPRRLVCVYAGQAREVR